MKVLRTTCYHMPLKWQLLFFTSVIMKRVWKMHFNPFTMKWNVFWAKAKIFTNAYGQAGGRGDPLEAQPALVRLAKPLAIVKAGEVLSLLSTLSIILYWICSTLSPASLFLILYFLFLSSSGSNKYRNQGFSLLAGEERQKLGISEFPSVNNSPL